MPVLQGVLHFDFSGGDPPGDEPVVISDIRMLNILFNLSLVTKLEKLQYLKLIGTLQKVGEWGCGMREHLVILHSLISVHSCVLYFPFIRRPCRTTMGTGISK